MPYPAANQEARMTTPPNHRNLIPALILIALGTLTLLGTLGWLGSLGGLVTTIVFGALAYLAHQQWQRSSNIWWQTAIYPLAGLAISGITPDPIAGAAFLIGMGIACLTLYRDRPTRWWAIIPAGVFLSLALPVLVENDDIGGALFLIGLAATFYTLTRLAQHPQRWGIYPAAVLTVIALIAFSSGGSWLVPIALIATGAWMLLKPDEAERLREQIAQSVRRAATITPATQPETNRVATSPTTPRNQATPPETDPRPPA